MKIKVLQKALDILELISHKNNVLPQDLVLELDIPRSTCVRILKDLTKSGYLVQASRGKGYSLGPLSFFLVNGSEHFKDLTDRAREILKPLAYSQRISVLLAVRHTNFRVILVGFNGDVRLTIDFTKPRCYDCHLSVTGRLLLAFAPEVERKALVKDLGTPTRGPFKDLTSTEIMQQLESYRESGRLLEHYKDRMAAALPVFCNGENVAVLGAVWREEENRHRLDEIIVALQESSKQLSSSLSVFPS